MANSKKTIFHAYAIVPLLAICAIHAIVWLGTKSLADFSRASDVTLGIDALFPLRPEWVVIYVATFLFWGMALLLIARQDEQLCCRFAAGVVIGDLICGIRHNIHRLPELHPPPGAQPRRRRLYLGAVGRILLRHADELLPVDALHVRLPRVPPVAAYAGRKAVVQALLRSVHRARVPVDAACQAARLRGRHRRHFLRRASLRFGTKTASVENFY